MRTLARAPAIACLAVLLGLGARASAGAPTVVVERGDTLAKIAERTLGNAGLWPLLYRANRDRIKDPARVYPGQELTVPDAGEPAGTARSEDPVREAP